MQIIVGTAGALLLAIVMGMMAVFALSDNASDHAYRIFKPESAHRPKPATVNADSSSRRRAA